MKYATIFFRFLVLLGLAASGLAQAQLQAIPPNVEAQSSKPMIMLNMSKDHQLFYRAYNEYTDINFDGTPDTTYNHALDYGGYFDSFKCYEYSGTLSRFVPMSSTTTKYCTGRWSGNFLNWATMTRMDVVRKVLYGGYRSTDTATSTVIERAYLPTDAHSFAKYYGGTDIDQLTPFPESSVSARTVPGVFGTAVRGLTICNTTLGTGGGVNDYSQTNTNPPLMRVTFGDFSLWNANERWQCYWSEEKGASNGNNPANTGLLAASGNPSTALGLTTGGAGPDYIVRVEACNTAMLGRERCAQYPNGNYKPIGLLHEFGENNQAEFALITGSFAKNISGGVLRRNMQSFRNEVNYSTDGSFTASQGIVYTLNKLRIYGYYYGDGTYISDNNCTYQLTGLSNDRCTSWGNPIGEMFLEGLRYLAGQLPSTAYNYVSAGSKDAVMGLTKETWVDPFLRSNTTERAAIEAIFGKAQCRAVNFLNFNASVISYDKDDTAPFSSISGTSLKSLIDKVGDGEGLTGTSRFYGTAGGVGNRLCDAKTLVALDDVQGLCPDAPAYYGSYSLSGLAYWAHTNKFRSDITTTQAKAFKATTYSIALSPGSPRISVASALDATKRVIIQPAYRLVAGGGFGGGTLVDFRIVTQTPTYGKYLIVWEDSEQGGDYDQDASGILEYRVTGNQLQITTSVFAAATANPQGFGYVISGTNGKDGVHFHSGIIGFNFTDTTAPSVTSTIPSKLNASGGCNDCQVNDPATTATYTITGAVAGLLEDPMLYAAKWGGFTQANPADPTETPGLGGAGSKWDNKKQDGTVGSDGIPDNYFVVYRPDLLENALRQVFTAIAASSNAAPAVSRPDLAAGDLKYVVEFDPATLQGKLVSYQLNASGTFEATIYRSGSDNLTLLPESSRQITTNVGTASVAFTYGAISSTAGGTAFLASLGTTTVATQQKLIEYFRGSRLEEDGTGGATYNFRKRTASIMGAVVNSTPWLQDVPIADLFGPEFTGYAAFRSNVTNSTRDRLLWIGSDDGMLHAFKASDLTPVYSFVPGALAPRLKLTADRSVSSVQALMDGSPFSGDVKVGGTTWKTYLFSSLGRGGKGIFALDVTGSTTGLTQGNAANIFKWQFTDADDPDLGYVLSEGGIHPSTQQAAQIAKLPNGKFAILLGNGVQSTSGKAALFILFVDGPSPTGWTSGTYVKIVADAGTGNGLAQPFWLDTNDDGLADTIYAGDLKGNMWKFDVSAVSPASWNVAYNKPLYVARDAANNLLPITTAPILQFHPLGGVVVTFGTGKAIVTGDFPDTTKSNRIFGIWDKLIYTSDPTQTPVGTTELQTRTWTVSGGFVLQTGVQAIDWATKKGWFINIPFSSGMVISNPQYVDIGSNILMTVIFPNLTTDSCNSIASGLQSIFDPVTGLLTTDLFGVPGAIGVITDDQKATYANNTVTSRPGLNRGKLLTRCTGPECERELQAPTTKSRIYWREIPGLRTLD